MITFGVPEEVAALRWEWGVQQADGEVAPPRHDQEFVAEVGRWMADDTRTVWTAHVDGGAVGMVCLTDFRRMPSPARRAAGHWGYLSHLYVGPQARGQGIGGGLVMTVLAAARSRNYAKVVLSPTEQSIPLYWRCGFTADHDLLMWRP